MQQLKLDIEKRKAIKNLERERRRKEEGGEVSDDSEIEIIEEKNKEGDIWF